MPRLKPIGGNTRKYTAQRRRQQRARIQKRQWQRSYYSRLKDRKINTPIEKIIKRVSTMVANQRNKIQMVYQNYDAQFNWLAHGATLRVPASSFQSHNAGTLFHLNITDFSDLYKNRLTGNAQSKQSTVGITNIRSRIEFTYAGTYVSNIRVRIIKIIGDPTSSQARPDISMMGSINGLNYIAPDKFPKQVTSTKYVILRSKNVTMPPAVLYTNRDIDAQGQIILPIHTEVRRKCFINYSFKKPVSVSIESNQDAGVNTNIYLMITSDTPFTILANTVTDAVIEGPLIENIPRNINGNNPP